MKERIKVSVSIAARIWIISCLVFGFESVIVSISLDNFHYWEIPFWCFFIAVIITLPILIGLIILIFILQRLRLQAVQKANIVLYFLICSCLAYGMLAGLAILGFSPHLAYLSPLQFLLVVNIALIACVIPAWITCKKSLLKYFANTNQSANTSQLKIMETSSEKTATSSQNKPSGSILIRAIITGSLILAMMIPTLFISNLVQEREERQKSVVAEVSAKWAGSQTLSGPFLFVPYKISSKGSDGKPVENLSHFWLLPEDVKVDGTVKHIIRPRSIYKVLLYRSAIETSGQIKFQLPPGLSADALIYKDIKICYGLSDFKGIEERMSIRLSDNLYELTPGLPSDDIAGNGLSAGVPLLMTDIGKTMAFNMQLKLKGSEKLHFIPLSGNSSYSLRADWPSPSFDGNNLPAERDVNQNGFSAKWTFNKANLPFGTILRGVKFEPQSLAFGATLLEPSDHYSKTNRSIKYAILFIGLTFSLFFIVELLQNKPMHPVQYTLIGLALVIFYTLLLSLSEFLLFDLAYIISAFATITLVTWYAGLHFKAFKPTMILCSALVLLYSFIFVLIRLEDTALLIGTIGLFIILAIAMYFSKRVNWYGRNESAEVVPAI